jgi:phage tail-like protein
METVSTSLSSILTDPIRNFKFLVQITYPGALDAKKVNLGFMSADGFGVTTESIPYRQGGNNTSPQYMPGQSQFTPITLSRGVLIGAQENWEWMKGIFSVIAGTGPTGAGDDFRASSVSVKVLDHPITNGVNKATPVKLWYKLLRPWPSSWSSSGLDAGGNGFLVETMQIVHEGFDIGWATKSKGSDAPDPATLAGAGSVFTN